MNRHLSPRAGIAGIILALLLLQPADAAVMSWGLRFFDSDGFAGSGKFSYDSSTQTFVELDPVGADGFYVSSALTSFSARILGQDWGLEAGTTWWADANHAPGQQFANRYGIFINDFWAFGDADFGTRQLALSGMTEQEPGRRWSGGWDMAIAGTPGGSAGTQAGGYWVAAPVPVPAALPLFASALAGLGLLSRRGSRRRR